MTTHHFISVAYMPWPELAWTLWTTYGSLWSLSWLAKFKVHFFYNVVLESKLDNPWLHGGKLSNNALSPQLFASVCVRSDDLSCHKHRAASSRSDRLRHSCSCRGWHFMTLTLYGWFGVKWIKSFSSQGGSSPSQVKSLWGSSPSRVPSLSELCQVKSQVMKLVTRVWLESKSCDSSTQLWYVSLYYMFLPA